MDTSLLCPPEVCRATEANTAYRPSWPGVASYLNAEHADIWEATRPIPGRQLPAESEKLYELAYHSGSVMLEIGTAGGRSAVVELRAALRAQADRGKPRPQFFGVTTSLPALTRAYQTLHDAGLSEQALLFHGDLIRFHHRYRITPTLVFVDGANDFVAAWTELDLLRTFLAAGTPVLVHDYANYPGVRQAVEEWRTSGWYDSMGTFGGSVLVRASRRCTGQVHGLPLERFEAERKARLVRHLEALRQNQCELERRLCELSKSRWRKLGLRLGLVKPATWERPRMSA
jgi:hypothetical protein